MLYNRLLLVTYFIDFISVSAEFYFSHAVHGVVFRVFACIQQIKDYMLVYSTNPYLGNSLVVQWLGLRGFTAKGIVSVSGGGTEIPQTSQRKNK